MSHGVEHLLLAFEGDELPDGLLRQVATDPPAGITLFASNVHSAGRTRELTDRLQAARPAGAPPLIVAADQEGGQLLGLGPDTTPFAGNLALGAADDEGLAERVGTAMGRELLALGVNVDYAPNCDLLTDPGAVAVGIRSFGDDPVRAGALAAAFIRGMRGVGAAATAKHFPGTGAVAVDSHHALGAVEATRELLERRELAVFRRAVAAGVDLVMTGHIAVPALTGRDDLPSTLSRAVVTEVLRGELGFDGVVVTDALDMHALAQGDGQVLDAIAALRAGVDLLLCTPDDAANERLRTGLDHAVRRGILDHAASRASAARVRRLRERLGRAVPPAPSVVGCGDHRRLSEELARSAITLDRDDGTVPLRAEADVLVIEPRPRNVTPADTTAHVPPTLALALRERLPRVDGIVYDDPPSDAEVAAVVARAREADVVVLGTSNASLVSEQRRLAEAVLASASTVALVVLRSPHDLALFPGARTALCTYGVHAPSTAAAADVLVGSASATGRLPVHLDDR